MACTIEERMLCYLTMDDTIRQTMLQLVEEKIAELQRVKEALMHGSTMPVESTPSVPTSVQQVPATSRKGHVSEEAKQRLKEGMTLQWAVRKAKTAVERKAAEKALAEFKERHRK